MNPAVAAALSFALAAGTAFVVSRVIVWCGPVDTPRERGLHLEATPTSGGLGIICGAAAGLLLFEIFYPAGPAGLPTACAFVLAAGLGLFGALDDIFDMDARLKLFAQLFIALMFGAFAAHPTALPLVGGELALPPLLAVIGTALWVVVVINAVNFMDGSNGLVAGVVVVVAGALGLVAMHAASAPTVGIALFCMSAAALGFLPTNFPRARLFMGDAGAQFLGGLLAMLAVIAAGPGGRSAPVSLLAAPIALTPLLTDVFLTLIARARRGSRLLDAHKEHLYQRWFLANGENHGALAARFWGVTGIYAMLTLLIAEYAPGFAWPALLAGVTVSVIGWLAINRRLKRA